MSTAKTDAASILKVYSSALSRGTRRNPERCSTPRQIADAFVEVLLELTAEVSELWGPCAGLCEAYLFDRPIPPGLLLNGEWPQLEVVLQACFGVREAARVGDGVAAWRAAASVNSNYRDVEDRLLAERLRRQAKAAAAARLAAAQKKGAETNRDKRDSRRQEAIKIYQSGMWDSRDAAITAIAKQMNLGLTTVQKYLRRATTS